MEKRLKLAKNLLKDTGVIFISIDDNEVAQLKLLMDDQNKGLFGENNFLGILIWVRKKKGSHLSETLRKMTEYILVYKRNKIIPFWGEEAYKNKWQPLLKRTNREKILRFSSGVVKATIKDGIYKKGIYGKGGTAVTLLNDIEVKNGVVKTDFSLKSRFVWTQAKLDEELSIGTKVAINSLGFGPNVFRWNQLEKFKKPTTLLNEEMGVGTNEDASEELRNIFNLGGDNPLFAYPKAVSLMEYLIKTVTYNNKDAIILDFMAGTGTTGQAVLELNKKDSGNRKFILCTNNEDNNSSGYKIAEDICYPRIKKVIEGYKNLKGEWVEGLGGNLKYFKTDFVDAEPTDKNKLKLTEQATEMLCIKESTFESIIDNEKFKLFKNSNHYTGIIWDQTTISEFKKKIKDIKGKLSIYVFSLGDETFDEEFKDIKQKVQLSPIPEAILRVYRRVFK
jgi:adenine-specific DNA-methyltransferase